MIHDVRAGKARRMGNCDPHFGILTIDGAKSRHRKFDRSDRSDAPEAPCAGATVDSLRFRSYQIPAIVCLPPTNSKDCTRGTRDLDAPTAYRSMAHVLRPARRVCRRRNLATASVPLSSAPIPARSPALVTAAPFKPRDFSFEPIEFCTRICQSSHTGAGELSSLIQ